MKPFQANITGTGHKYGCIMSYSGSDKVKIGHALPKTTNIASGGTQ